VIVLDTSAGLGGTARWLTFHYGCRVPRARSQARVTVAAGQASHGVGHG